MRLIYGILSTVSFLTCSYLPVGYLSGSLRIEDFKSLLLGGSIGWSIFASLWVARGRAIHIR